MRFRVCFVSDFFYPNVGGVESHLYQLAQCLIQRGHKVVVVTHAYGERHGVRYMTNGLKVYYAPLATYYNQNSFPTIFTFLPLFRTILIRERIDIVHGHQAFSTMCNEALLHARVLGYRTVFTDHSLTGFGDVGSIHINKVLKFTLSDVDHVICVSHTSKENTVLRGHVDPRDVSVIPNAIDAAAFAPDPAPRPDDPERRTVVVLSRMTVRKGTDLLARVIPDVCRRLPGVRFLIGGDGPRRVALEEMRERHELEGRVELLGPVAHSRVRELLVRGDVFLNASLTEAFCIAVVEAAACGLFVVSTDVGGLPEVLPPALAALAPPAPRPLADALLAALHRPRPAAAARAAAHAALARLYSWPRIAARTERVYRRLAARPPPSLRESLPRYLACGPLAGPIFCGVRLAVHAAAALLARLQPPDNIDPAPDLGPSPSPIASGPACSPDAALSQPESSHGP
eukprot:tig00001086_g6860.t1